MLAYLVADDSPIVSEAVAELLREVGVVIVGPASDGREALRLYREARPQGAVLDFDMPHATGLDVLQVIRAEQGDVACLVIILTANAEDSLREACLAAGADHFLSKAQGFVRLQEIVADHLAAWAERQQSPDTDSEI